MRKTIGIFCSILLTVVLWAGSVLSAEQVFFYITDPAGTPLAMTDSTGKVVWKADYKPFGEEQSVTGTVPNTKRFVGKEKDEETGLEYFGARYMNNKTGRFVSPDQVRAVDPRTSKTNENLLLNPQSLNTYSYGLNNPYRYVDPDGHAPFWIPLLSNLIFPSTANAPEHSYTPTVRSQSAAEFAGEVALMEGGGRLARSVGGAISRGSGVEAKALEYALKSNKIDHLFNPKHGLNPLVNQLGSRQNVVKEVIKNLGELPTSGKFEVVRNISGTDVTIRGSVVEGVPKIGTMFARGVQP